VRVVRFRSVAESEIAEAVAWYHARNPAAARRLTAAIDATVEVTAIDPERFPRVSPTLRRVAIPEFPYRLYFRVFPDVISIVACVHVRRDPSIWQSRE